MEGVGRRSSSLPGASGTPTTGGSRPPPTTSPLLSPSTCLCVSLGHGDVRSVVAAGITGLRGCPAGGQQRVAFPVAHSLPLLLQQGSCRCPPSAGVLCECNTAVCVCVQYSCVSVCVIQLCAHGYNTVLSDCACAWTVCEGAHLQQSVWVCSWTSPWPSAAAGFCVRFSVMWLHSPKERQQRPVRLDLDK